MVPFEGNRVCLLCLPCLESEKFSFHCFSKIRRITPYVVSYRATSIQELLFLSMDGRVKTGLIARCSKVNYHPVIAELYADGGKTARIHLGQTALLARTPACQVNDKKGTCLCHYQR
jgi:hypothetical protein